MGILVGNEDSGTAKNALKLSIGHARRLNSKIIVVNSLSYPQCCNVRVISGVSRGFPESEIESVRHHSGEVLKGGEFLINFLWCLRP